MKLAIVSHTGETGLRYASEFWAHTISFAELTVVKVAAANSANAVKQGKFIWLFGKLWSKAGGNYFWNF